MNSNNIILISDVYEMRQRKEEELRFYQKQLEQLNTKMLWVKQEINVTNHIIDLIEKEKADILENK